MRLTQLFLGLMILIDFSISFTKITKENGQQLLNNSNKKVVYFHSSSDCSNCERIKSNLQNLTFDFSKKEVGYFLVDCSELSDLCNKHLDKKRPPAIAIQISAKLFFYYGDYSPNSVKAFVEKRYFESTPKKFTLKDFKEEVEKSKNAQHGIFVYAGNDQKFITDFVEPLNQFEIEDTFFVCESRQDCSFLFSEPSLDILFQKISRTKFLSSSTLKNFDSLHSMFYDFKNLFLIPFGKEFEKKVLEELSPTVILTLNNKDENTENKIEVFTQTINKHSTRCYASIIPVYDLNKEQKLIFDKFRTEVGLDELPLLMIIEPDMETLKMQNFFYSFVDLTPRKIDDFVIDWINRRLTPSKKSQNIKKEEKHQGFTVLNYDGFKNKVFVPKQESVVFVHKDWDLKSKKMFELFKKLSLMKQFDSLIFFVINGQQNDLPVFVSNIPCFLIFAKNSWENPLVYDNDNFKKLVEVIQKRHELIFDEEETQTDDNFGDFGDLSNGQGETVQNDFDSVREDEL